MLEYESYAGMEWRYQIGVPQVRHDKIGWGPMAVFKTLKDLIAFVEEDECDWSTVAFKCEYTPSKDKSLWCPDYPCQMRLPEGTAFADSVTLLEEVKRWNFGSSSSSVA